MADTDLETEENGRGCETVSDRPNEVISGRQTPKRCFSTGPDMTPPRKSPRTDSASGPAEMTEGHSEAEHTDDTDGLAPAREPAVSPIARRKSWRRATISRRSLPALPSLYQALCSSISTSLPQQERLEKLMEASMKRAIESTQTSLQSVQNISLESFQKQVEHIQKEWACLAKDISSEPQSRTLRTSTTRSCDPAMQTAMEKTQKAIHRLQVEADSWEALLNKHKRKAEELERKVEQGLERGIPLDPSSVAQSSQYQIIQSKLDYCAVLGRQRPVLHTMAMIMDTQCKMVRELLSVRDHAQLVVKQTSGRLATEAGLPDPTPDLIRDLVAVPCRDL
ncbi:kinetochore-associated protein DSN1 homolog isoform X2 [Genypterus blacodes]|uniref:kinetochore-associated protein DSN1 homolog isoform X2 n=1 Tax=Genypterus blacodes TaxID=154954 RepID=UPI003F75ACBA